MSFARPWGFDDDDALDHRRSARRRIEIPQLSFTRLVLGVTTLCSCAALELAVRTWLPFAALAAVGLLGVAATPTTGGAILLFVLAVTSLAMEAVVFLSEARPGVHPMLAVGLGVLAAAVVQPVAQRSPRRIREDPFASSAALTGRLATVLETDGLEGCAVVNGEVSAIQAHNIVLHAGDRVRVVSGSHDGLIVQEPTGPPNDRARRWRWWSWRFTPSGSRCVAAVDERPPGSREPGGR